MNRYTDIHCHILPGVDDGARSREETAGILQHAYAEGIRRMIATSHYNPSVFAYTKTAYEAGYAVAVDLGKRFPEPMQIYTGHEIFYTGAEVLDALDCKEALTLAGSDYVLVEFAIYWPYDHILNAVRTIAMRGYIPIIAHVERYDCLYHHAERIEELIAFGAYIQMNASFVTTRHSFKTKRFLNRLLSRGDIHFIATDAHDTQHRPADIRACAETLTKKYGRDFTEQILNKNPNSVLMNQVIG